MNPLFKQQYTTGFAKEKELMALLSSVTDFELHESTDYEDIHDHVDFKMVRTYNVDVKSLKKRNRQDESVQEDEHFVEIKNVQGKTGWAYSEATDYFAFESFDYWIFVHKDKLQALVKEKVQKLYVQNVSECLYKLYQRQGRRDIITKVKTLDLMAIADEIITKKKK
jgi:hypothetical protein